MLHNPRRLALALLAAHVVATTTARANPANFDALNVSRSVQFTNVASFVLLAGILHRSGSLRMWPNILPLAVALGGIFGAGALFSFVANVSSDTSAFLWSSGVVAFISTAFYAAMPEREGWMRHAGLALFLIAGVPIMYAIPRILANRVRPDQRLVTMALEASTLAYTRGQSDTFRDAEYANDAATGSQVGIMSAMAPGGTRDIYIAFAGTTSKTDWLNTNIRVQDVAYPKEWLCGSSDAAHEKSAVVHAGFLSAYAGIREKAWNLISDYILRTAASGRIIVCGHSLGGAVATIAAIDLVCKLEPTQKPKVHAVTFGSPHVGNASFAKVFDARIPHSARVVTVYDPVPNLLTSRYVHVKGAYTVTFPLLDSPPISAHLSSTYGKAVGSSGGVQFVYYASPLILVVFFLALFAKV